MFCLLLVFGVSCRLGSVLFCCGVLCRIGTWRLFGLVVLSFLRLTSWRLYFFLCSVFFVFVFIFFHIMLFFPGLFRMLLPVLGRFDFWVILLVWHICVVVRVCRIRSSQRCFLCLRILVFLMLSLLSHYICFLGYSVVSVKSCWVLLYGIRILS